MLRFGTHGVVVLVLPEDDGQGHCQTVREEEHG